MPDNVNITVNETIENIVINPSISTDVIDVNTYSTTENVTIDVTPNLTTVNINTITGSLITKTSDLINDGEDGINPFITLEDIPVSGLTSVGLTMPVAFNVANSPLTSDGTIAVSAAGTSSQYIRGDGQLATLPTGAGGGSTVAYYLNGSINASVAGYKQLSNLATIGGGTDFTLVGNGLIAQFLTDLGNPNRTEIPGGAWNFEMFFQSSSAGGSAKFYVELLKYDGITFTSIASSVSVPEEITGGTAIDLYLTSLAVPTTPLLVTDRLAIRVYIVDNAVGRTITLHTEDNTLCEIITTFSGGVTSLNGLTANTQYLAVGTTGTDFNISSLVDTHTFNLPTASATNRGALSTTDWTAFNGKFNLPILTNGSVLFSNGTTIAQDNSNFFWDDTNNRLGIGTTNFVGSIKLAVSGQIGGSTYSATYLDLTGAIAELRGNSGIGYYSSAGNHIFYGTSSLERMRLLTSGNLLINTTVDQGGKLQIKAPGALSTDIALRVRNSADSGDLMTVAGNGATIINGLTQITGNATTALTLTSGGFSVSRAAISFIDIINATSGKSTFRLASDSANYTDSFYIRNATTNTYPFVIFGATSNIVIGSSGVATDQGGKLQIKAPGALSTDIALRVRNSADTFDLLSVNGLGNVGVGIGTSLTTLQVNQLASTTKGILISGDEIYATGNGNSSSGVRIALGVSRATNRQLWIGDNDAFGSATLGIFRFTTGTTGYSGIDAVSGNGVNRLLTLIGTDTSNVGIGNDTNGNANTVLYTAKLNTFVYNENRVNVLLRKTGTGTGDYINAVNASSVTNFVVKLDGTTGIGTGSPTARLHIAAPGALSTDIALRVRNSADTGDLATIGGTGILTVGGTGNAATINLARASNGGVMGAIIQPADFTEFYNYQGSGFKFYVSAATTLVRAFITTRGVGITGTTGGSFTLDASALLQGNSTTQGFLPPRMTTTQRDAIATPAVGLMVYCTDVVEGLYINKSTGWTFIG